MPDCGYGIISHLIPDLDDGEKEERIKGGHIPLQVRFGETAGWLVGVQPVCRVSQWKMLTKPHLQYPFALDEKKWTAPRYLMHPVSEALQDCNELSRYCRRCARAAPLNSTP